MRAILARVCGDTRGNAVSAEEVCGIRVLLYLLDESILEKMIEKKLNAVKKYKKQQITNQSYETHIHF